MFFVSFLGSIVSFFLHCRGCGHLLGDFQTGRWYGGMSSHAGMILTRSIFSRIWCFRSGLMPNIYNWAACVGYFIFVFYAISGRCLPCLEYFTRFHVFLPWQFVCHLCWYCVVFGPFRFWAFRISVIIVGGKFISFAFPYLYFAILLYNWGIL